MAAISGKDGNASVGGYITSWSLNQTQNNPSWASSETSGYKERVGGMRDVTASVEGKTGGTIPTVGASVTVTLTVATGVTFSFNGIVESVSQEGDFDDGEITSYSAELGLRDTTTAAPTGWA